MKKVFLFVFILGIFINLQAVEKFKDVKSDFQIGQTIRQTVQSSVNEVKPVAIKNKGLFKKDPKGNDSTIAIILGIVSVLFFPFALHNWYLGNTKKALWQCLMIFPGFILFIPPLISWIWQLIDLVKIIMSA